MIWNFEVRANSRSGKAVDGITLWTTTNRNHLFYWLDAGNEEQSKDTKKVNIQLKKDKNLIQVNEMGTYLKVLVNSEMLDLSKPIIIRVGEEQKTIKIKRDKKFMEQTLWERGDWNYIFEGAIEIEKEGDSFSIK